MTGGGRDRAELQPYNPQVANDKSNPNRYIGCHKGSFFGLNIVNPRPDRVYAWANNDDHEIHKARIQGYIIIDESQQERAAYKGMTNHTGNDVDTASTAYPGVVMVYRPIEVERRIREEERLQREQMLRGGVAENSFLSGAGQRELEVGRGTLRLLHPYHHTSITAGESPDGDVQERWTPDEGITRGG